MLYTSVQSEREGSARGVKIIKFAAHGAGGETGSSFIIKVMDYREFLDEGILRCDERRSTAVVRPQRRSTPTRIGTFSICYPL